MDLVDEVDPATPLGPVINGGVTSEEAQVNMVGSTLITFVIVVNAAPFVASFATKPYFTL